MLTYGPRSKGTVVSAEADHNPSPHPSPGSFFRDARILPLFAVAQFLRSEKETANFLHVVAAAVPRQ